MDNIKNSTNLKKVTALILLCSTTATNAALNLPHIQNDTDELWTGLYLGLNIGGGSANGVQTQTASGTSSSTQTQSSSNFTFTSNQTASQFGNLRGNASGYNGNAFIGWNFHSDKSKFIIGGQLEGSLFNDMTLLPTGQISGSNFIASTQTVNGTTTTNSSSGPLTGSTLGYASLQSIITLTARAGLLVKPDTLVYGFGGAAKGHISHQVDVVWTTGYTAGAGLEHKINRNWSVIAEYRYLHFNLNSNYNFSSSTGNSSSDSVINSQNSQLENIRTNLSYNLGSIGIAYRWA